MRATKIKFAAGSMKEQREYDIWSDADGRIKSAVAIKAFVDNSDAPYLFDIHEIRVNATSGKEAIKQYRIAANSK